MQKIPSTPEELLSKLKRSITLDELQEYMQIMFKMRGFVQETAAEDMLLLIEEVGELAKALRKEVGLKVDTQKMGNYSKVSHEIADVLIMLIVLTNRCNINLFDALFEKEQKNAYRSWQAVNPYQKDEECKKC